MGSSYLGLAYVDEARELLEESLHLQERQIGPDHPDLAATLHDLADALRRKGERSAAAELHERALRNREAVMGADDPLVAASLIRLSNAVPGPRAEKELLRAVRILEGQGDPHEADRALAMTHLAFVYFREGRLEESEALFRDAIAILEAPSYQETEELAWALSGLASTLEYQGQSEEALSLERRALAITERLQGSESTWTLGLVMNLGVSLHLRGDYQEAEEQYLRVLNVAARILGPTSGYRLTALINLGELHRDQGRFDRAEQIFEETLGLLEDADRESTYLLSQWGLLHAMAGRPKEAERLFRRSLRPGAPWLKQPEYGPALEAYAELLRDSGRSAEAEALLE